MSHPHAKLFEPCLACFLRGKCATFVSTLNPQLHHPKLTPLTAACAPDVEWTTSSWLEPWNKQGCLDINIKDHGSRPHHPFNCCLAGSFAIGQFSDLVHQSTAKLSGLRAFLLDWEAAQEVGGDTGQSPQTCNMTCPQLFKLHQIQVEIWCHLWDFLFCLNLN